MAHEHDTDGRTIAGNFQCQMQLSQQRNLVVTGYIYSDDTPEQINKRLDMYQDALDRQFIRCDIVNKEAQVKALLANVEQHIKAMEKLKAKTSGAGLSSERPPKLSSVDRQRQQNDERTVEGMLANVEMLRAVIAEGHTKLGTPVA